MSDHDDSDVRQPLNAPPTRRQQIMDVVRKCAAEFVAVAYFVFIGSLSAASGSLPVIAAAHGFAIGLMIMTFGYVSGGHINPAVTLGATLSGALKPLHAVFYVLSQLLGAIVGSLLVRAVVPFAVWSSIKGGVTAPGPNCWNECGAYCGYACNCAQLIVMEAVLTFGLVTAVLNAAVESKGRNALAPLAIGLAVFVGVLAGGTLSGASMNPARSFGPAVVTSLFGVHGDTWPGSDAGAPEPDVSWRVHYVYWVGPLVGGAVAAALYKPLLATERPRLLRKC